MGQGGEEEREEVVEEGGNTRPILRLFVLERGEGRDEEEEEHDENEALVTCS